MPSAKSLSWFEKILAVLLLVVVLAVAAYFLLLGPWIERLVNNAITNSICAWFGAAQAFVDANENGLVDEGEAPLPGVQVLIYAQNAAGQRDDGEAITDADGFADLTLSFGGSCSDWETVQARVEAITPPGYRLTTADIVDISPYPMSLFDHSVNDERENPASVFGFVTR